jgi:hypothetical protein
MADEEDESNEAERKLPPLLRLNVPDAVIRDFFAMAALVRLPPEVRDLTAAVQCYHQADACMEARKGKEVGPETGIRRTTDTDHEHRNIHMREEP